MKNILITALLSVGCCAFAQAQCDKKSVFTSSKTEFLNAANEVQRTSDETATVTIDKTSITIVIKQEDEQTMTGEIKSSQCNWTSLYKEGTSVMKVVLSDPRGDTKAGTITLEGKAGAVTLLLELDDMPDRKVKVKADSFKEQQ